MPLLVFALAAYAAGLLAGFANSLPIIALAVGAAAVTGSRRGRTIAVTLSALAIAGVVAARSARDHDEHCDQGPIPRSIQLVVDDSAAPGAFVRARVPDCEARVGVSVDEGSAAAGSLVSVVGDPGKARRGFVVHHATVQVVRGPPILARWRASAGHAIDRTFRGDAPLVRALLIADRQQLSPELRERYAAAGLAHILAIAGLHIGIIAMALTLALDLFGVPKRRAAVITIVVVVLYVAIIGAPIPALRSASMLVALFISRTTQRPTSRWSIVALGALHPVVEPRVVLDAGYQLSVVGVAAMISSSMLGARLGLHRLPWLAKGAAMTALGATVATIATAPIVALFFGRVSLVAPLSNLAATPLIELAQPMVFCGMVLAPIPPIAKLFADAAHPVLAALDATAIYGASVPHGGLEVSPTPAAAAIACVMSLAVIVACASKEWTVPATVATAAAIALLSLPLVGERSGMVELHMMDVGQGDAIALRTSRGRWVLFDAGPAWRGGDAAKSTIIPYLGRRGGAVDLFVLSHPHTDHVGGAPTALRAFRPRLYVDAGFPGAADAYRTSLDVARRARVQWVRAHPGDSLEIDGVTLTFLAPDSAWTSSLNDPNLASVVTLVRAGGVRMLLTGDAERPEEEWLIAHDSAMLRADVLKVAHHGSRTSSTDRFLEAVRPRVALVSVGQGNTYHLPTPSIMRSLAAHGAQVLRTDQLGTIVVRTDGQRIWLEAGGAEWEVPISPLRAP